MDYCTNKIPLSRHGFRNLDHTGPHSLDNTCSFRAIKYIWSCWSDIRNSISFLSAQFIPVSIQQKLKHLFVMKFHTHVVMHDTLQHN